MLDITSISSLRKQFEDVICLSRPNFTLDTIASLHNDHKFGNKIVFVKFFEDYNLLRSLDNYPNLLMFTGCFNLVEAIYYVELVECTLEEKECQPAVQKLNHEQLEEYSTNGKMHMNMKVLTMSRNQLDEIKWMYKRGYSIYVKDDIEGTSAILLKTIDHLDTFLGKTYNPEMIFIALDMKKDQPVSKKSEPSLSSVYDLPLHEEVKINDHLRIIAVPGGWLYVSIVEGAVKTSTFVPNTLDNIAKTIFDVLNYLNDDQASINSDGDLLEYIKEYLK